MRTIVIGDIHGCYDELKCLITNLKMEKVYKPKKDKLIFLGDYVDRGDKSKDVVALVRELQRKSENVIALMGNHEDMLLNYFNGYDKTWLYNGCDTTADSYGDDAETLLDDMNWMYNLPLYYEDDYFIYAHAGINKSIPVEKQNKHTLLWIREAFYKNSKRSEKTVIFGHTPTMMIPNGEYGEPYFNQDNNCIGIDTGCVFGGNLTALIIDNNKVKEYYQVRKGEKTMKKTKVNNEWKTIIAQAFYGNRVLTEVGEEHLDKFILGRIDYDFPLSKEDKIDRTVLKLPEDNNLAIVYNKYEEEKAIEDLKKYPYKPLAINPETGDNLYSRCVGCRLDNNGNLCNLEKGDIEIFKKYLVA